MANNTKENKKEVKEAKEFSLFVTEQELEEGKRFWCNREDCWLLPVQCTNRQDTKEEGCVRCAQGNVVRTFDPMARADSNRPDIEL